MLCLSLCWGFVLAGWYRSLCGLSQCRGFVLARPLPPPYR